MAYVPLPKNDDDDGGGGGRGEQNPARDGARPRDGSGWWQGGKMQDLGGAAEKVTWHRGTHELGRKIRKLLEQIVFWG
jgi:hypothetical protein